MNQELQILTAEDEEWIRWRQSGLSYDEWQIKRHNYILNQNTLIDQRTTHQPTINHVVINQGMQVDDLCHLLVRLAIGFVIVAIMIYAWYVVIPLFIVWGIFYGMYRMFKAFFSWSKYNRPTRSGF